MWTPARKTIALLCLVAILFIAFTLPGAGGFDLPALLTPFWLFLYLLSFFLCREIARTPKAQRAVALVHSPRPPPAA